MEEERYYDEYEIDLREYIMLLWNAKWFIIGLFVIAIVGAGLFSQFYLTPTYETEATIYAPDFEMLNGEVLTQNTYISFIRKPELEEKVIEEFSYRKENEDFSVQNLDKKLNLTNTDSNLVKVKFSGTKPSRIKNVLDHWIKLFKEEVKLFLNNNNENYINNLEKTTLNRKNKYENIKNELNEFKKESNVELLKNRLNNKENMLVGNSSQDIIGVEEKITNLNSDINKFNSQLNKIEEQLQKTDKFIISKSYIDNTSLHILREALPNNNNLDNISINEEIINTEYTNLIQEKNKLEQNVSSSESELEDMKKLKENLENEIKNLQIEVANKENQLDSLQEELEIAQENYKNAEEEFSKVEQELSSKDYQITVVNSPVVPENPVSPNTKLNVAIAGVLALMLGVFIVFFREFLKEEEEEENK